MTIYTWSSKLRSPFRVPKVDHKALGFRASGPFLFRVPCYGFRLSVVKAYDAHAMAFRDRGAIPRETA